MVEKPRSKPVETIDAVVLSNQEEYEFHSAYADLKPEQVRAAQMEAAGISKINIATQLGMPLATLYGWTQNSAYVKLVNLSVAVIDRCTREYRLKLERNLSLPIYMELMNRVANEGLSLVPADKLVDMWAKINKEIRTDTQFDTDKTEDSELREIQKRREKFNVALRDKQINDIMNDDKIIEFPKQKISNG